MPEYHPDEQSYCATTTTGARRPVVVEFPLGEHRPERIYRALRERYARAFLLESGKNARYSYVGVLSPRSFRVERGVVTMPDGSQSDADPFDAMRRLIDPTATLANERLAGFSGGWVGYLAYDMARYIERLPELTRRDADVPDCLLHRVETFCEIDHDERTVRLVASFLCDDPSATYRRSVDALGAIWSAIEEGAAVEPEEEAIAPAVAEANMSRGEFEAIVERAKEYIRAGDIFQVNLSLRFSRAFEGEPLALYSRLRSINPSPYMALIELPQIAVVSASPELLVKVRGATVETRPIAGTRPRGASDEEDARRIAELTGNEKERAEHLMLVDLERNDIGRVARFGSVRVEEFMGTEKYSHVMHIVSHISGELAEGRDTIDAIRACFPGGTITGAPKVRSMEIIEELEPVRRGVYTGSIGWIGFDGSAELNIAIRTIAIVEGRAYAQAGAGIVADSVAEHEYRESLRKAAAALEALSATVIA